MNYLPAILLLFAAPEAFAALPNPQEMMRFVLYIIVIGLVLWLLWWLIGYAALPEPFAKVAKIILAVVAVFFLINLLLSLIGSPLVPMR